jgi:hypothetical protein
VSGSLLIFNVTAYNKKGLQMEAFFYTRILSGVQLRGVLFFTAEAEGLPGSPGGRVVLQAFTLWGAGFAPQASIFSLLAQSKDTKRKGTPNTSAFGKPDIR